MPVRSRLLLGVATALLGLVAALPAASADPPAITHYVDQTGPGERIDLSEFSPSMDCGTSHVELTYRDVGTLRVYYDNGLPIKVVRFHKGTGTLWLIDDATGDVLATETGSSPSTEIFDLRAMTYTTVGTTLHNNVPGLGRVAQAGGRITYRLVSFDTGTLSDPVNLGFDLGEEPEVLSASAKSAGGLFDIDWCPILEAQV
jgi:hypothetical protein